MTEEINVRIELESPPTFEDSQWLEAKRSELQRELGIPCNLETADHPDDNTMDGGMTTAIAIAGLSLAVFDRILMLVKHYKESPNTITITEENGIIWTKTYHTDGEREEILSILRQKKLKNAALTVSN